MRPVYHLRFPAVNYFFTIRTVLYTQKHVKKSRFRDFLCYFILNKLFTQLYFAPHFSYIYNLFTQPPFDRDPPHLPLNLITHLLRLVIRLLLKSLKSHFITHISPFYSPFFIFSPISPSFAIFSFHFTFCVFIA